MELYILSKHDLSILSIGNVTEYEINLDEETNAKSTFKMMKTEGLEEGNFVVLNGLYKQFLFVIPTGGIEIEKDSNLVNLNVLEISNIFDRKVIEKNIELMENKSIEEFIANTMYENFVNSNDNKLNIDYIDISWHTNTKIKVETESENGLYNFHTFLVNCRQKKNIYITFHFENQRLEIHIEKRIESSEMIDTTLREVTEYNKVFEEEQTAKVQVYIREDESEYNLYLRTDRTTTEDKDDVNRARGKIEVISVETKDKAAEEAENIIKNNQYNHLVEFKIAKTSELMDVAKLHIGKPIIIKTKEDIYNSYISAITIKDGNYIYFKSGKLRTTLLDKLKSNKTTAGNKLDKTGGIITGDLNITGNLKIGGTQIETAYCQMSVNGITIYPESKIVDHFGLPVSYGGFIADIENSRLEIPVGTEAIEVSGLLCGYGYCAATILIKDSDGNRADYYYQSLGILTQFTGNGYWKSPLPSKIIKLDNTKKYYITLEVGGYNGQDFELNNGYGEYASWIQAKKIR